MNLIYEIAGQLNLGTLTEPSRQLSGGFLHRMFSLSTACGKFAVKLLNPHIMARPTAMENYRRAEAIESLLEETDLPILPALRFGGEKMQRLGKQYYYVFRWFDGRALKSPEITVSHCRTIGGTLARMHFLDRHEEACIFEPLDYDWDFFIHRLTDKNPDLGALIADRRDLLDEAQRRANEAFPRLPGVTAICHNDMDSKNVLWHGAECRIIDLECLGRSNPYLEMYETALCWSGVEEGRIDLSRFEAFTRAYAEAGGELPPDLTVVHDANAGRLGWLEYNLRRALGIDCSPDEISVGESETRKTLAQLECCARVRTKL